MKSSPTISLNATSFDTILWWWSRGCICFVNFIIAMMATAAEIAWMIVNYVNVSYTL